MRGWGGAFRFHPRFCYREVGGGGVYIQSLVLLQRGGGAFRFHPRFCYRDLGGRLDSTPGFVTERWGPFRFHPRFCYREVEGGGV